MSIMEKPLLLTVCLDLEVSILINSVPLIPTSYKGKKELLFFQSVPIFYITNTTSILWILQAIMISEEKLKESWGWSMEFV